MQVVGENHYSQFIGNKLEIFDFRVHLVYLIVGLKIEEVISGRSEQPSVVAEMRCRKVTGPALQGTGSRSAFSLSCSFPKLMPLHIQSAK